MRVRCEKSTDEQIVNAPELQEKPRSNPPDAACPTCPAPRETLIERVVDFMDTYHEN